MRRLLAILALGVSLPILLVLGLGADDRLGPDYKVRAVFDNVASAVPGEDVKVAGAKVGVIESMDVTAGKKAAVTLRIDDGRFAPFRADAKCVVRPQSLIGEKFIECEPGTASEPELDQIGDGEEGEGEHLLPLERTQSQVDLDLFNNILRRPYGERFALVLSEFGTGLAGRGEDLKAAIHRANPALRETDRVLAILARQNRVLADLARDSDVALAPLAREKERVSGFIVEANNTAKATAARRDDIERGIQRLPRFLDELRPLMADLNGFASQAAPVFRDLNAAAPQLSRVFQRLGPFSRAAQPSLLSLGEALERGRPALIRARPLIRDLGRLGRDSRPVAVNLDRLTRSLDRTGGIERLMDLFFYSTLAINGFDSVSHYLRAGLLVNTCSGFATQQAVGCNATFRPTRSIRSGSAASSAKIEPRLADDPAPGAGSVPSPSSGLFEALPGTAGATPEGRRQVERIRRDAQGPSPALRDQSEPVLDYLLGDDR
ncbi:MAG TPA: MlaD family protein [Thermoleophilaceae bacterium]|nr:MlaD family protein [Thermoleophilaceae bacterium]